MEISAVKMEAWWDARATCPAGKVQRRGQAHYSIRERGEGSGWNVRDQLHSEQGDMVFQLKTALLQAAQLQLFVLSTGAQKIDNRIQITVFNFQFNNALFYVFGNLVHAKVSMLFIAIISYRTFYM
jgi:hypothetical protein